MSAYAELSIHRWMLRDRIRNEAYRGALAHRVKPGDVVLDMGAGTGILSMFSAIAGAKKVYAVERTEIAEVAKRLIAANGHAGVIEVLHGNLEDITLPEKVDVIVSEWMGGFGVDENMLAPLVIARDRWLRPGGAIIPGTTAAILAPISVPEFDGDVAYWHSRPHGIDTSLLAAMTTQEMFHTQAPLTTESLIAPPQQMWAHDPLTCTLEEADRPFTAKLTFTAARTGTLSGLGSWFTAEMGDGTVLTNAIGAPITHWGRTLFPFTQPIPVTEGMPIVAEVHCDPSLPGSCEFYWSVQVGDGAVEEHDTRPSRQRLRR